MRQVLLFGGGVESSIIFLKLVQAKEKFSVAFVDYGQLTVQQELKAVLKFCHKYVIPFKVYKNFSIGKINQKKGLLFGNGDDPFVTARNFLLISEVLYDADVIYVGSHHSDITPDGQPEFYDALNIVLDRSFKGEKKVNPMIINDDIRVLVREIVKLEPDFFHMVFSCWVGVDGPCHKCRHCSKIETLKSLCGV